MLKIEFPAAKAQPIAVGSSRDLVVGQKVYAIGNPFGLDQKLTTGILSALNREIESVKQRTIRGVSRPMLPAAGLRRPAERREHCRLQPQHCERRNWLRHSCGRGQPHRVSR